MRILLIEDEPSLLSTLDKRLREQGYAVDACANGIDGLHTGREYPVDLAIVDLGLPDMPGMDVIASLRADGKKFPILILTARDAWQDKVSGLQAGADDYLVKPFHLEELLARVNALLRRTAGFATPVLSAGPVALDTARQEVKVNDAIVELTTYEYKVLDYLMHHPDEVVSKTRLTEHIYNQDFDRDSNVIEVFVGRLRKKLDPKGEFQPIETLRGRGYRLNLKLG